MVDLRGKPFYLGDEDIAWVEQTIAGMSDEEKIGQLFMHMNRSTDPGGDSQEMGDEPYTGVYEESVFCDRWDTCL